MRYLRGIVHSAFVWLYLPLPLLAQQAIKPFEDRFPALHRVYRFVNYSTAQGLPGESCLGGILVDSDGFLWVGSVNGLSRFNGHDFEVFRNNPSDSNSIGGNHLFSVLEDKDGCVWISPAERGVNRFDKRTGTFRRFWHDPKDSSSLSDDIIWVIFQDRNENLWFGGERGLNKLSAPSVKPHDDPHVSFVRFVHRPADPNSLSEGRILWMSEEPAGTLLIGSDRWVDRYDPRADTFAHFKVDPRIPPELQDKKPLRGFEGRDQMVWIRTSSSLYRYDRTSSSLHLVWPQEKGTAFNVNWTWAPYQDSEGSIWLNHQEGVFKVDPSSFQVTSFPHGKGNVSFTRYDNAGNIWFGTTQGLDKLTLNARRFSHLFLGADSARPFNALGEDDDGSLLGCRGLNLIRLSPGRASVDSIVIGSYPIDFCTDDGGTGWVATWGGGLYETDKLRRKAIAHKGDSLDPHSIITSLCKDRGGILWLGTYYGGLHAFDTQTKKCIKQYRHDSHGSNSVSNDNVVSLLRDSQGIIWIGTELGGLNRFDPRTETFSVWRYSHRDSTSLSGDLIYALHEDDNGDIWAGADNGLNKFNRVDQSFTRYLKRENTSNSVQTIAPGNENSLWVGYYDGSLSRFDLRSETFKSFAAETGLLSKERWRTQIARGRSYRSKWSSGELVFNTINGILVFCPDSVKDSEFNPQIVLTRFSVFETLKRLSRTGGDYQPMVVPYDSNFLSIEFVALDLTASEHNQYAYKLDGYEDNWNNVGTKREANYTKVPHGEYVFRVKGTNSDGIWSTNEASLKIIITPPWWKTIWAYLGYGFVIVGVLYSIRRSEKNRDRLKHRAELEHARAESLQEVDSLKSRFFANISHEFRTPLTLILGPIRKWNSSPGPFSLEEKRRAKGGFDQSLSSQERPARLREFTEAGGDLGRVLPGELRNDLGMMERNAQRLLRLINQLLDLSKLESGAMKLRASRGNIVAFVKGLTSSFESSADMRRVAVSIHAESDEIEVYFDKDKMEKILTNLLSNAFKFTPDGGEVTVQISNPKSQIPNHIEISIADTGIGIPADELPRVFDRFYQVDSSQTREHEGSGIGLALTKELVELHHGSISVKSEVGKGTEFTVRLPLGRGHLKDDEVVEEPSLGVILSPAQAVDQVRDARLPLLDNDGGPARHQSGGQEESAAESQMLLPTVGRDQHDKDSVGQKPLVLIVEDNADVRAYMREYLVASYEVQEAHDGAEGIDKAKEIIPDLIISDVMMPKKDGYELCKTLKLDEKTSHIPIILLTAKAGTENKIEGLETGADDYLTKPFDAKELLVRVKNLIELRRKLRERFSLGQVLKPGEIAVTSADDQFLQKAMAVVEKQISNEKFSVDDFAKDIGMSRTQLHRKLTALTSQSAGDFIRYIRLHRAKQLLEQNAGTVAEIAFQVGFSSAAYFTKCFREQFGIVPSEVRDPKA